MDGDEKFPHLFNIWTVIATGMLIPRDDRILCDIFLERIRPPQKLQLGMHEFDRMRDDDPQKNLRWLTDSTDRLLQRERMLNARALQTKRIQSGASLTTDNSASSSAAPAQDKDKGKGKGKGERQPTNPKEWAMYPLLLGFALTMRNSGSARRIAVFGWAIAESARR